MRRLFTLDLHDYDAAWRHDLRPTVRGIIEKDGKVTNVRVVKGVSPELDAEALKVVSASPKWKPGLVIFIAWILSIFVVAAWIISYIADKLPSMIV